jgi:hypothetical protein
VPAQSQPPSSLTLTRLATVISALAAMLWLLPLFSPHSVLFPAGAAFADILVYKGRFTLYHTLKFFTSRAFSGFAYPPGAAILYEAFYTTSDPVQTYLLFAALTTLIALAATWLFLRRNGIIHLVPLLLLSSFPLVILIQRANIELLLWIVIATGILAYRRGLAIPAAVLFGLAASVKLYPIFLIGLFLRRKQDLRAFAVGLATAILSLIAATAYAGPTFLLAARGFTTGLSSFQDHYIDKVSKVEVAFDHSLFSPLKYSAFLNHASPAPWTHTYYFIAGSFALLLFLRVRSFPFLNRLVFLLVAMVSLPPVSFTYTLVHLYLPILLLCGILATRRSSAPKTAIASLALLLFVTLPLVSLNVIAPGFPAGPIHSFVLLALLVLSTLQPWPSKAAVAQPGL